MLLREKQHIAKRLTTESSRNLITSQLYPVVRRKTDNLNQRTTIVEFEQGGNAKAKYGDRLLVNLSKDLTRLKGRGFGRSVLTYMRKFYLAFPKCATVSHKLNWSHYLELLKCESSAKPRVTAGSIG